MQKGRLCPWNESPERNPRRKREAGLHSQNKFLIELKIQEPPLFILGASY